MFHQAVQSFKPEICVHNLWWGRFPSDSRTYAEKHSLNNKFKIIKQLKEAENVMASIHVNV